MRQVRCCRSASAVGNAPACTVFKCEVRRHPSAACLRPMQRRRRGLSTSAKALRAQVFTTGIVEPLVALWRSLRLRTLTHGANWGRGVSPQRAASCSGRFDLGLERSSLKVAKCLQIDCAISCRALRSVESTAVPNGNPLVPARDATALYLQGRKMQWAGKPKRLKDGPWIPASRRHSRMSEFPAFCLDTPTVRRHYCRQNVGQPGKCHLRQLNSKKNTNCRL